MKLISWEDIQLPSHILTKGIWCLAEALGTYPMRPLEALTQDEQWRIFQNLVDEAVDTGHFASREVGAEVLNAMLGVIERSL